MQDKIKKSLNLKLFVKCALFIAAALTLPMVFHAAGMGAGQVFLPMHIPVLLCGLVCGPLYGLICGVLSPLLSSILTNMPKLYPAAVSMAFELAAYGFITGYLYTKINLHFSLIGAMLCGRLVSGTVNFILLGVNDFALPIFLQTSFVTALPGIAIQLALIPTLIYALQKAKVISRQE